MEPTRSSWASPKPVIVLVGIVLLAGIIITAIIRDRIVNQPYQQVTVMGQGRISYSPDVAVVTLGAQVNKAASADVALQSINTKITAVIAAVEALGISRDDVQTQNLSLYPEYDYVDGRSIPAGYTGNQQVAIKIRNIGENVDLVSKVIEASSKAGANQITGVSFEASNMEALKQEARIKAIADAKEKSGPLAEASGIRLKEVVGWYENQISPTPQPYYGGYGGYGGEMKQTSANPQVPSGLQEVVIEIGVNYTIK